MKRVLFLCLLFFTVLTLSSCTNDNESPFDGNAIHTEIYVQTFNLYFYVEGKMSFYVKTSDSEIISEPEAEQKENYIFEGWYTEDGVKYDFTKPSNPEITKLYARYTPDYVELFNVISTEYMAINVKIEVEQYNKNFFGFKKDEIYSRGSGVIFYLSDTYGFVLTNEHVTDLENRDYQDFTIIDYKGNQYEAHKQANSEQDAYDLSVLYFKLGNEELKAVELAQSNPNAEDEVIAIGQPKGQNNTITFGKTLKYKSITLTSGFTPNFDVLQHDAEIDSGSSGGALLDIYMNLVGLNFASSSYQTSGEFAYAYAIPIEIIHEYLDSYVWKKD